MVCKILVPLVDQGSNLYPLQWNRSLNHWTIREVPCVVVLNFGLKPLKIE